MSKPTQTGRAVIVGASVAGLFAGRVLADHFDEVLLVDKETLDQGPTPRKAVPQGNHIHGILTPTFHNLERFLPELIDDLIRNGAHIFDGGKDWKFHVHGNFLTKGETGQTLIGSTRPFFEDRLRRMVTGISNIEIRTEHRFKNWVTGKDQSRVEGVVFGTAAGEVELSAELLVDARGRGSTLSKELQELGYEAPVEELVGVDLGYTTRLYKASNFSQDWNLLILNPSAPESWIGGLIEKVENEQFIVTQFGYFGDHAPANDDGFLERAKSLAVSDIADFLEIAEPVTDFHTFGTKQCKMIRFEKLQAFPERLLVIGDAVCNLNPIYGQGLTKAAREAGHLWDSLSVHLEQADSLDGFSDKFRRSLPGAGAEWAWQLTSGADLGYPQTTGKRQPIGPFMGWYMKRLFMRSAKSLDARKRLFDTLMLVNPPEHLFKPGMIGHALGF
jgi:2-polyprenyl-6-methoxyphenol hydroxylase-like FAD-dependent oxidoreductase